MPFRCKRNAAIMKNGSVFMFGFQMWFAVQILSLPSKKSGNDESLHKILLCFACVPFSNGDSEWVSRPDRQISALDVSGEENVIQKQDLRNSIVKSVNYITMIFVLVMWKNRVCISFGLYINPVYVLFFLSVLNIHGHVGMAYFSWAGLIDLLSG